MAYTLGLVALIALGQVFSNVLQPLPDPVLISSAVAFVIGFMFIGQYKDATATLIHEIGHAMAAGIALWQVNSIRVERDTSGVMWSRTFPWWRFFTQGFVSAAGPMANIVFLLFTVRALTLGLSAFWLAFVAGVTLLIVVSTVRNFWGILTGILFAGNLIWLLYSVHNFQLEAVPFSDASAVQSASVGAIMALVSHNAGSTIRYNLHFRKGQNPNSDEYKFGKSILLGPWVGGHVILLANLVGVAFAAAYVFGLSSPLDFLGG